MITPNDTLATARTDTSRKTLACVVFGLLLCLSIAQPSFADQEKTLDSLQDKIKSLRIKMSKKKSDRSNVLSQIKERDGKINSLLEKIKSTKKDRQRITQNLSDLGRKQVNFQDSKLLLQDSLMRQLEAAYKTGKQSRVKLLLNQKDPEVIGRLLGYHNYLHIAREEKINSLQNTIESLKELEEDIKKQTWQLTLNEEKLEREQKVLAKARAEKKRLLSKIDSEINTTENKIQRLSKEQQRIKRLMAKLEEERLAEPHVVTPTYAETFAQQSRRLQRPTAGPTKYKYNSIISGDIRRQGIFISAREGSFVRAVFDGKIVYSDRFQKKGLMTIISHGQGYMTLYAHNKVLLKNVGDTVNTGDKIAVSGSTGNTNAPGLYFEIRKDGKPLNPSSWLIN